MSKQQPPSVLAIIALAILAGIVFPLTMTALARRILPAQSTTSVRPYAGLVRQKGLPNEARQKTSEVDLAEAFPTSTADNQPGEKTATAGTSTR